jgi:hypothetical protein
MRFAIMALLAVSASTTGVLAHHGWGSYDAAKPVTVTGAVLTSEYTNPHVVITVKDGEKIWTLTLAPTSRMINRGAPAELVAVGRQVVAFGYPSTVTKDEMRAERITVDGKAIELR